MEAMTTFQKTSQLPPLPLTVRRKMVGFNQRLAERIVEARGQKGWSRRDLAYKAEVSDKTLERLEKAEVAQPRGNTLQKIAEALGVEVADLRPDMETEEKNLRAQLDRIETVVNDLADKLGAIEIQLSAIDAGREPQPQPVGPSGKSHANGTTQASE